MQNLLRHVLFAAVAATAASAGSQATFWDGPAFAGRSRPEGGVGGGGGYPDNSPPNGSKQP
jgi:hypothetical protein